MSFNHKLLIIFFISLFQNNVFGTDYFVHPTEGKNSNTGLSKAQAFKTLDRASENNFLAGDRLFLASGQTYYDALKLINKKGSAEKPIEITTILWNTESIMTPAKIDFKGKPTGIFIEDSSFIIISNIQLTANGYFKDSENNFKMRCAILVTNKESKKMNAITLKNISIYDVYYENSGFTRGKKEIKTANGTQKYGWGIRVINKNPHTSIETISIENCHIKSVAHTGIKLTGNNKNISNVYISDNTVNASGGPGIQMSEVKDVTVVNNIVSYSGSNDDSRKWGRGSGLWTWGSSRVLIEKNKFLHANGPGDSAGAHIDFNCDNIVLQYNISAYNAGGFCEILGNNYNCAYRYNISINDGHRTKGIDGAFQEGKILWLSGYQGQQKKRKGPVNSYFYNNTIYSDSTIVSKIAIDNTSNGIFIANNIFYLEGVSKAVLGDQYKPDTASGNSASNVFFKNNLFLNEDSWPKNIGISDISPIFGNPDFTDAGGIKAEDYAPKNVSIIKNKGIEIKLLPNDSIGVMHSLKLKKDILGHIIQDIPSIGAIEPTQ